MCKRFVDSKAPQIFKINNLKPLENGLMWFKIVLLIDHNTPNSWF